MTIHIDKATTRTTDIIRTKITPIEMTNIEVMTATEVVVETALKMIILDQILVVDILIIHKVHTNPDLDMTIITK